MDDVTATTTPPDGASAAADADSVRRTLGGEVAAFDQLIERYQRRVVGLAYRLVGNSHEAADIAQDAFLRAFRSLATLQEVERFGPWLMRITHNLAMNHRRRRHSGLSLSDDDTLAAIIDSGEAGNALVEAVRDTTLSQEATAAIQRAIEKLPEKQRLSLIYFAIEGRPQKEVAEILECGVEAVKWNVFQARKKLKEELAEYLIE